MKEKIRPEDIKRLRRNGKIMSTLTLILSLSALPLLKLFVFIGNWYIFFIIWALFGTVMIIFAFRAQKFTNNLDIHTYKEVIAFINGKELNEAERNQEYGKRPYQKIFGVIGFLSLVLAIQAILYFIFFVIF